MTPRVPRAVARRIDRLARGAHAFHRFAHHPLCDEYAGELVALGRRARVCRGCLHALAGGMAGALTGLFVAPAAWMQFALASMLAVAALLWARQRARVQGAAKRSPGKFASRFLPLALTAFVVSAGLHAATAAGLLSALLAAGSLAGALAIYRSVGPSRGPCTTCPERAGAVPCRGYQRIWRRERAFSRRAQRLIDSLTLRAHGGDQRAQ